MGSFAAIDQMGELRTVRGAYWDLEIGAPSPPCLQMLQSEGWDGLFGWLPGAPASPPVEVQEKRPPERVLYLGGGHEVADDPTAK